MGLIYLAGLENGLIMDSRPWNAALPVFCQFSTQAKCNQGLFFKSSTRIESRKRDSHNVGIILEF